MNWKHYRNQRKQYRVPDATKQQLFSRIQASIAKESLQSHRSVPKSVLTRYARYVRPLSRVGGVAMLSFTVFLVGFVFERKSIIEQPLDAIQTIVTQGPTVTASPVGQVIQAQGTIRVIVDGSSLPLDDIPSDTPVVLSDDAYLVMSINDTIEARITGPARLVLQRIDEETTLLNLLDGDYAEVVTLSQEESIENDALNVDEERQEKPVQRLIVKIPTMQIEAEVEDGIDMVIDTRKESNAPIVTNEGERLVVKHLVGGEDSLVVESNQSLTRTDQIWTVESQDDETLLAVDTLETPLAIRYEIGDTTVSTLLQDVTNTSQEMTDQQEAPGVTSEELLALVTRDDTTVEDDEETGEEEQDGRNISAQGRVLSEERMQQLQESIAPTYIEHHTQQYLTYMDDAEKQQVVIQTLVSMMNRTLAMFNATGSSNPSKENLKALTDKLILILKNDYFIAPSVITPLESLSLSI